MSKNPENWMELHIQFCEDMKSSLPKKQAKQLISETESALIRLVLPCFNFVISKGQIKLTKATKESAFEFMTTLSVRLLPRAQISFEESVAQAPMSQASRNTYGNRVRNWFSHAQNSGSWPGAPISPELTAQCAPHSLHGHGSITHVRLTPRRGIYKSYALKPAEMNPELKQWFEQMEDYLMRPKQPGRCYPAIKAYTFKMYRRGWRQLLGWQTHYNGVPLDELRPHHIFPVLDLDEFEELSPLQQKRLWREKSRELEAILCGYHNFLLQEMKAYSPHTWHSKLVFIHAAGRIFYQDWVTLEADYCQLPLFKILKASRAEIQDQVNERQQSPDVACLKEKWPNVPDGSTALEEFQKHVLELMRQDCRPRTHSRKLRSPQRIAHRYQQFCRVGGEGYMPPLRSEVARDLKVALSCEITRPDFVPPDGHYYPLPPDDLRDRDPMGHVNDNYVYRTYSLEGRSYPDGVWIREVQEQKTRKSLGIHVTIIPNRQFPDGSCFYQYLESYLEGVWQPQSWNSIPYQWNDPRYQNTMGNWVTAGRSTFEAEDLVKTDTDGVLWRFGFLFISPKSSSPYSEYTYLHTIRTNSNRLIGKAITPHTMRYIWATWGGQVGLSDVELRSLAYMMGHSVETLRRMYAKMTPIEKQQPIMDAINARLCQPGNQDVIALAKMLRAAHHLTKNEQHQLFQLLQTLLDEGENQA